MPFCCPSFWKNRTPNANRDRYTSLVDARSPSVNNSKKREHYDSTHFSSTSQDTNLTSRIKTACSQLIEIVLTEKIGNRKLAQALMIAVTQGENAFLHNLVSQHAPGLSKKGFINRGLGMESYAYSFTINNSNKVTVDFISTGRLMDSTSLESTDFTSQSYTVNFEQQRSLTCKIVENKIINADDPEETISDTKKQKPAKEFAKKVNKLGASQLLIMKVEDTFRDIAQRPGAITLHIPPTTEEALVQSHDLEKLLLNKYATLTHSITNSPSLADMTSLAETPKDIKSSEKIQTVIDAIDHEYQNICRPTTGEACARRA